MGSLTARAYTPEDWPLVSAWWASHTTERALIEGLVPPVGVIVELDGEPIAACWAHLSVNIGVAFLEAPVTKPGMKLGESLAALAFALGALEEVCRTHDYHAMVANTLPAIARHLERNHGFHRSGDRVQLVKILN